MKLSMLRRWTTPSLTASHLACSDPSLYQRRRCKFRSNAAPRAAKSRTAPSTASRVRGVVRVLALFLFSTTKCIVALTTLFSGTTCDFFRAKVTDAWVGPGTGTYLYESCYSVHPAVGDVALGAPTASASTYLENYASKPTSVNFFCLNEDACYESMVDNPPWWRVDLGAPRKVSSAKISLSALIDTNIEFRVGNDTTVTNNPELLPKPTVTPYNGLELVADTPITGRYFFVTEPHSSDIRICDVWVMTT